MSQNAFKEIVTQRSVQGSKYVTFWYLTHDTLSINSGKATGGNAKVSHCYAPRVTAYGKVISRGKEDRRGEGRVRRSA